jgi:hypothetical protein
MLLDFAIIRGLLWPLYTMCGEVGQWRSSRLLHPTVSKPYVLITIFVNLGLFRHFETVTKYKNMNKITQILENVVRCKYFEAGVHIKNTIKTSYQDGLGRMTQILDHVVVVHILY